jgi:hypothetical protein
VDGDRPPDQPAVGLVAIVVAMHESADRGGEIVIEHDRLAG